MNKGFDMFLNKFLKKTVFVFICLFIITGFDINSAQSEDNFSCYRSDSKSGDALGKMDRIKNGIKTGANFIPVIGSLINYLDFYFEIVVSIGKDITDIDGIGKLITNFATYVLGNPEANITFQRAFNSNQYCQYQDIFKEEDSFLNTDNKRYSVFPSIPLEIGINNEGQCDISGSLDGNFKQLIMTGGSYTDLDSKKSGTPFGTKCSYSYTNLNSTCLFENTLPIAVIGEAAQLTVDVVCGISGGNSSESASKLIKFKEYLEKFASGVTTVASYAVELMALPIFEYDAYSLKNYYGSRLSIVGIVNVIKALVDQNYVCASFAAGEIATIEAAIPAAADIIFAVKYNDAKNAIQDLRFCGYNWYSYAGVKQGDSDFITGNNYIGSEYFERGPFEKSYSYAVSSCINNASVDECKNKLVKFGIKVNDDGTINNDGIIEGENEKITSKSLFNRIYREYLYNGKEYRFNYRNGDSYDPRLPEYKGYHDVAHRYYMRGNEKANYSCERFTYNGLGCVLRESDMLSKDIEKGGRFSRFYMEYETKNNNDFSKFSIKYGTDSDKEGGNKEIFYIVKGENIYEYDQICRDKFNDAYEKCYNRSKNHVCVENINKKNRSNKFCKATYETDQAGRTSILSTVINGVDDVDGYCNVNYGDGNSKAELLVVKQEGNQYACVFSNNFCPYDFKLNAGLNYKASYCESDYTNKYVEDGENIYDISNYKYKVTSNLDPKVCSNGIFTKNTCSIIKDSKENIELKKYAFDRLKENVGGEFYDGDYNKIYHWGDNNTLTNTAAYGRIKNFCQYKAHCVKVEKDNVVDTTYDKVAAFIDMSCNGKSVNSRNYLNFGFENSSTRQLSATVVECVYESLKNLVNGVAGYSSCKGGYKLNSEGYCGSDTKQTIDYKKSVNDKAFFDTKYYFVKGYELPVEMNPFLKVQKNIKKLLITAMALALILWGYKVIGIDHKKFGDFANADFIKTIMPNVVKFCLIVWLALNDGWRSGLADKLFEFASGVYEFTNKIFITAISNEHNTILRGKTRLGIEKTNNTISGTNINLINFESKYDIFNDLVLSEGVENIGDNSILISNNQEISELTYFISKLNKKYSANTYKLAVVNEDGTYSSSTDSIRSIWNNKYDGCYFDVSEYEDSKSYLAIFDAIDCRIIRYLGFAPGLNIANIFLIPLFLTFFSTIGAFILSVVLTFVFTIFNLMIEIIFTFVISFFTLSLMIFLSPIILPMSLFGRTKNVFNKWLNKIMSCIFQPVVLVVTVIVFINVLDIIILRDMTFYNHNEEGRYPTIKCEENIGLFCIINKPGLAFVAAADTIAQGFNLVTSIIKGNFSLDDYPAITMLVDLLLIFILFKLGNDLISYAKAISEALFGKTNGLDGKGNTNELFNGAQRSASNLSKYVSGRVVGGVKGILNRPFAKIGYGLNERVDRVNNWSEKHSERRLEKLRKELSKAKNDEVKEKLNKKIEKFENNKNLISRLTHGTTKAQKFVDSKLLTVVDHVTKNSSKEFIKDSIFKKRVAKLPKEGLFGAKKLLKNTLGKRVSAFDLNNDKKFLDRYYKNADDNMDKRVNKFKSKYEKEWNEFVKNDEDLKGKNDRFVARKLIESNSISKLDNEYKNLVSDIKILEANKNIDFEKYKVNEEKKAINNTKYKYKYLQKLWMIPGVNLLSTIGAAKDKKIKNQNIQNAERKYRENVQNGLKNIFGDKYKDSINEKIDKTESKSEKRDFMNLRKKIEEALNEKTSSNKKAAKNSSNSGDKPNNGEQNKDVKSADEVTTNNGNK